MKLNEKSKGIIKSITKGLVKGADYAITDIGCIGVGGLIFDEYKKSALFGAALMVVCGALKASDSYDKILESNVNSICDCVFNKLENSNQKVVEFEK